MPTILINGEAEDYDHWREFFDAGEARRDEHGVRASHVFRGTDVPNEFAIIMECDDLDEMRALSTHPDQIQAEEDAGVDPETTRAFVLDEVTE